VLKWNARKLGSVNLRVLDEAIADPRPDMKKPPPQPFCERNKVVS
jgi:hypothetical protein